MTATTTWKPDGYPSVSPYLLVRDAPKVIAFLERMFGATPLRRLDAPDGSVMHAEVRIGDSVIMLGQAGGDWKPIENWMHVYVSDVDATYERGIAAGGVSVQAPKQRDGDDDKRGGVKDPGGNVWWIATQVGPAS